MRDSRAASGRSTGERGSETPSALKWLSLSAVIVLLDQLTKLWANSTLSLNEPVPLLPSLNLSLLYNRGAAFSLLANASGWQRWLFTALAVLVSVFLVLWLRQLGPQQRRTAAGLSLVLGGAVGNVIDRIAYGHVVDFIDAYYGSWHWPAFNVADSAISVGVVLLLVDALRPR